MVNVHPPPEENRGYSERSQDTIGTFSEGSSGVDYEEHHWESADRMFPQSGRGSGLGQRNSNANPNRNSTYSVRFISIKQSTRRYDENERGTWYQKRLSSRDAIDDAVEYPVSRVSGPLTSDEPEC